MNDLIRAKAQIWNERLKKCMDENNLTQASFAEALSRKYNTEKEISQKTVSRWLNVGSKVQSGTIGFPKFDSIILIADFFNVDIGYLTGEINEDTFLMKDACSFTGLNSKSIEAIRKMTNPDSNNKFLYKDIRETVNSFLSSDEIFSFIENLDDLLSINRYLKIEFEFLDDAIDYSRDMKMNEKLYKYLLNEALTLLINEIYSSPDFSSIIIKNK